MELIGFDKKVLTASTNVGTKIPNLSDVLNIHCDLVNDSFVDGEDSDIVYSFSTSVLRLSYSLLSNQQESHIILYIRTQLVVSEWMSKMVKDV